MKQFLIILCMLAVTASCNEPEVLITDDATIDRMAKRLASSKGFKNYYTEINLMSVYIEQKLIRVHKGQDLLTARTKIRSSKSEEEIISNLGSVVNNPALLIKHSKSCALTISQTIEENKWLMGLSRYDCLKKDAGRVQSEAEVSSISSRLRFLL